MFYKVKLSTEEQAYHFCLGVNVYSPYLLALLQGLKLLRMCNNSGTVNI